MLNNLLREYAATRVSYAFAGTDPTTAIIDVLNKIDKELSKTKYKSDPSSIENKTTAMLAFFEMFVRKIGGDMPALCCYYYSTLVANDTSLPHNPRITGNLYRAFITFKNMDKWNMLWSIARTAPINRYRGHLDETAFLDLLLLSDVYKAWDADSDSPLFATLKRQAPSVASNHPNYTKEQVMVEGELAHKAIFNVVETLVKI